MKSDFIYDLLIIGGGISACIFVSKYLQSNSKKKVALIEVGRGLGGRSSTRISKRFEGWELNHGAPNFNIYNRKKNELLQNYIEELLQNEFITIDNSDSVILDEESNLGYKKNSEFSFGDNYLSLSSMSQLSQNIIGFNNLKDNIDFYFETLIVDLIFNNDQWNLKSKDGENFKTKNLVCSTNLLLHKRSLQILNINQVPLRKAIPEKKDEKIDSLLSYLEKQTFIRRLTFLIYTSNKYTYKDIYSKKNRYFYLKELLENKYKFERIIFQSQKDNKLGIVIHSKNVDFIDSYIKTKDEDSFKQKILNNFNKLFESNPFINQLIGDEKISIMKWRASQPSGYAVPLSLQFSRKFRIGFCGDWFEGEGFGRIEGSMLSALRLVKKFKTLN